MRAMVMEKAVDPLQLQELDKQVPGPGKVLIGVEACGAYRTDLHILEGELDQPALPLVPGHDIVGRVEGFGPGVTNVSSGQRVGVPWLGIAQATVPRCRRERLDACGCLRRAF